jgi:hypothetical protein
MTTLNEAWLELENVALQNATILRRLEAQRVFYAGASVVLGGLVRAGEAEGGAAFGELRMMLAECRAFSKAVEEGRA